MLRGAGKTTGRSVSFRQLFALLLLASLQSSDFRISGMPQDLRTGRSSLVRSFEEKIALHIVPSE